MFRGLGLLALAVSVANAQQLDLPWGKIQRLPSPDGSKILYGVPYQQGKNEGPQLWIEDMRTHRRTKLFDFGGTLGAEWSPDGRSFLVDNHWASDREDAYIYDAATLQRLDIGKRILAGDPKSCPFAGGHRYFAIERWEGNDEMIVRFSGHTDEPPVTKFEFQYRVSRPGAVKKLSQRTALMR